MTDERFNDIVLMIQESFEVIEHETWEEDSENGEYIVFESPIEEVKIERIWKPKVIDRKVVSSKRTGSSVNEEFVYSDTEKVAQTSVYRLDEEGIDWVRISLDDIGM